MSAEKVQNPIIEDDEVPTLEAAEPTHAAKQSKRYAKAMSKMGLKPEPNVVKITIRKHGSLSFLISDPELYRFPGTNTFLVFGEAQLNETGVENQEAAARAVSGAAAEGSKIEEIDGAAEPSAAAAADSAAPNALKTASADNEEEGAGEFEEKEINVVMSQSNTTRSNAIRALRNNKGDIVNAILELTS